MSHHEPLSRLFARRSDIMMVSEAGETVMLDTRSWSYFDFDPVGAAIWTLLEAPQSLEALVAALCSTFDVDEDRCRDDTAAFLDDMIAKCLVTAVA